MHTYHLKRAVELCGGQTALAKAIGKKQAHIWWWLNKCKKLPSAQAIAIENATGGLVTRAHLRPDIFPVRDVT
ncbi:YdaS family helix-turn-helix protein [Gluconobacter cerinus]|uniref:transcriptional regulator n=1 Tax=Gluconobacter cerinus TaxID=38307 RepID=UPI000A001CAB|nr:YdaS family helix-turn-helix protein [Gluconobacter cerinus]